MSQTSQPQNPLFFEYLKKELSFIDILEAFKILFSSVLHGFAQGVTFAMLGGLTWLLSKTVLGEVILPMLGKTFLGAMQKLLPSILASYAGSVVLGGLGLFWLVNVFVWRLNKTAVEDKANPQDKKKMGLSPSSGTLLLMTYFVGAWLLPTGMLFWSGAQASLASASWLSAITGGVVTVASQGIRYAGQLSERINNKIKKDLELLIESHQPKESDDAEIELHAQSSSLQQYRDFLKQASEDGKKNKDANKPIQDYEPKRLIPTR